MIFGFDRNRYMLGIENGRIYLGKSYVDSVYSDCYVKDTAFHHVVVTKNGNKIVFYLDGVAQPAPDYNASFDFNPPGINSTNTLANPAVGSMPANRDAGFIGTIDRLAVFNHALTEDEVMSVYEAQK